MMSMDTILKVQGLVSGYNKSVIIRDVNLEIQRGEIVSIIGRNGVGKSTLIKTIIGVCKAMGGTIEFDGQDVTNSKPYIRARRGMGYAPQGNRVYPRLSVEENLIIGRRVNEQEKEKSLDIAYEYFPILKERRKQQAGSLSGGEQAMLTFGRALVGRPKLMLLDELSEGIQPNVVDKIGEIALLVSKELGLTILISEQHIGIIQQISHRAYAIDKGTVVGILSREELQDYGLVQKYLVV